jgi:hypothetical protein
MGERPHRPGPDPRTAVTAHASPGRSPPRADRANGDRLVGVRTARGPRNVSRPNRTVDPRVRSPEPDPGPGGPLGGP